MSRKSKKSEYMSRRGILPILGSTFLMPFLGFGKSYPKEISIPTDEEYQTLLKPDGTAVKVKVSAIKKSKIIKKNISNTSFLNWLGKEF